MASVWGPGRRSCMRVTKTGQLHCSTAANIAYPDLVGTRAARTKSYLFSIGRVLGVALCASGGDDSFGDRFAGMAGHRQTGSPETIAVGGSHVGKPLSITRYRRPECALGARHYWTHHAGSERDAPKCIRSIARRRENDFAAVGHPREATQASVIES